MSVANIALGGHGATATIDPASVLDAAGLADAFVSPPVWTSDNPAIATVTGAADGMSADIQPVAIGTCNAVATYTNPDGVVAASSNQINVTAAPVDDVASFSVNITPNP